MNRITVNPKILGGKPIVRGTRISVEFILELLASGVGEDEILTDYSHLTKEDIYACIRYAVSSMKNGRCCIGSDELYSVFRWWFIMPIIYN